MKELQLADQAMGCATEAIASLSRANRIIETLVAELIQTRHELVAYRCSVMDPDAQVAEIERLNCLQDQR